MGQMRVVGGSPADNLNAAEEMIRRAAKERCDLVVLPECLDLGWTWPRARELASPIPGPRSDRLAACAKEAGIWVVAGLTERSADRVFNAAVLLSDKGKLLAVHRKINELSIAHHLYDCGDRLLAVRSPFGPLGVTICADNFPDSLALGESLARMGVRTLLSPCAWAVDADDAIAKKPYGDLWLNSYGQLAHRFGMTVVGVSYVGAITAGPWEGRVCIGNSIAVGPGGTLAVGPYGVHAEELIVVDTPA
jgi:predicted amidohydrolase